MRNPDGGIVLRAAYPAVILAVGYWALFAGPVVPHETGEPQMPGTASVEQTRELVERTRSLMRAARYQDALEPAQALHATDPTSHIYAGQLAEIFQHLDKPAEESRYLELYVRHSPTPWEACPRLGEAYWAQRLTKQSLDAYKRCLDFDEEAPDSIFYMARAYEWNLQYDEAQRLYERGAALDPQYLDMHLGLARLQLHRGHTAEARTAAQAILHRSPKDVDAMLIIGLSYQRDGNQREARQYLEQGLKLNESYADFHLALGMVDEADNHVQQAMAHYTRTIALAPMNQDAVIRRDRLAERMKR